MKLIHLKTKEVFELVSDRDFKRDIQDPMKTFTIICRNKQGEVIKVYAYDLENLRDYIAREKKRLESYEIC